MKLRQLGQSDINISAIGLGCWQFSGGRGLAGRFWPALSQEDTDSIVRVSLEGKINWFDTAEMYGHGQSEANLARALKNDGRADKDVVVATKWTPFFRTARSIGRTVGNRLRYLDGYSIDLHQIHAPIGCFSGPRSQINAMADLVEQGKIRAVGISNFPAWMMRLCHKALGKRNLALVSNQMKYSLLDRRIESNGVMDTAKELGITIIAYSPIAQGVLSGKYHDDPELTRSLQGPRKWRTGFRKKSLRKSFPVIEELRRLATKYKVTPAQVALNWLIHFHGETVVAIPGATKVRQAEENVGAMSFTLTKRELQGVDEVSRPFLRR